jgi:RNA polymerase sigma-70 factor (ECF subfamily)
LADTPISLLERLRIQPDSASWRRFVDLYPPLLCGWPRRHALQPSEVDDVVQEGFAVLVRELPQFRHDWRRGAFRRWLRGVLANRLRVYWRDNRLQPLTGTAGSENLLGQLEDPESSLGRLWDEEHDRHVAHHLLELMAPEFEPATWQAFTLLVFEGRRTAEVAARLSISANGARIAKSRVFRRLRQDMGELVD